MTICLPCAIENQNYPISKRRLFHFFFKLAIKMEFQMKINQ